MNCIEQYENEIKKTIPFTTASKRIKTLRNKPTKWSIRPVYQNIQNIAKRN